MDRLDRLSEEGMRAVGLFVLAVGVCEAAGRERSVVRKDWRSMSRAERKQFTDAVNALKRHEGRSYDSFVCLLR